MPGSSYINLLHALLHNFCIRQDETMVVLIAQTPTECIHAGADFGSLWNEATLEKPARSRTEWKPSNDSYGDIARALHGLFDFNGVVRPPVRAVIAA